MAAYFDSGIGFGEKKSWHGQEELLPADSELRFDAMATFQRAALDYEVYKVPFESLMREGLPDEFTGAFTGMNHVIRSDNMQVLTKESSVSDTYTFMQNMEMAERVQRFLESGKMALEFVASLQAGRIIYAQCRLLGVDMTIDEQSGDRIDVFQTFANGHDGTFSCKHIATDVRTVCSNTFAASLRQGSAFMTRHTKNMSTRLDNIENQIQDDIDRCRDRKKLYKQMLACGISEYALQKYLQSVFGVADKKRSDISTRKKNQMNHVENLVKRGLGQDGRLSYWAALNGVTEWLSHYRKADAGKREFSNMLDVGNAASDAAMATKAMRLAARLTLAA